MSILEPSSPTWPKQFNDESKLLKAALGTSALDIQHFGSTSIPGMMGKPIIDIAVAIPNIDEAHSFVESLQNIGYTFFPESSSQERLFFRKGDPVQFHLSLAQKDKFGYWKRQVLFRDYLRAHPEAIREYEALKLKLIEQDPTGQLLCVGGKGEFVKKILDLAEKETSIE